MSLLLIYDSLKNIIGGCVIIQLTCPNDMVDFEHVPKVIGLEHMFSGLAGLIALMLGGLCLWQQIYFCAKL